MPRTMTDAEPAAAPLAHSVAEAARLVGVSTATIRRLAAAGELRTARIGQARVVVPHSEVERLLAPSPDGAA